MRNEVEMLETRIKECWRGIDTCWRDRQRKDVCKLDELMKVKRMEKF